MNIVWTPELVHDLTCIALGWCGMLLSSVAFVASYILWRFSKACKDIEDALFTWFPMFLLACLLMVIGVMTNVALLPKVMPSLVGVHEVKADAPVVETKQ